LKQEFAKMVRVDEHLALSVTWFDATMDLNRRFTLTFFPGDNSVEMHDVKLKRVFLSRIHCDTVTANDLYVGNTVIVFSRNDQEIRQIPSSAPSLIKI
jgi:nucleoside-diphosphate kinase